MSATFCASQLPTYLPYVFPENPGNSPGLLSSEHTLPRILHSLKSEGASTDHNLLSSMHLHTLQGMEGKGMEGRRDGWIELD